MQTQQKILPVPKDLIFLEIKLKAKKFLKNSYKINFYKNIDHKPFSLLVLLAEFATDGDQLALVLLALLGYGLLNNHQ